MKFTRLEADIPNVTYDLGQALYKDRLLIRSADAGRVQVSINQSSLDTFARQKYGKAFSNVKAVLTGNLISITGRVSLLSNVIPFSVEGELTQHAGRYVDITGPVVTLNGNLVGSLQARGLLERINPVLDIENDLHLEQIIHIQHVSGIGDQLIIEGEILVPRRRTQAVEVLFDRR